MKKLTLLILLCATSAILTAQMPDAISIDPPDATAYDEMTLTFDPSMACFEDSTLNGLPFIAMHAGVTITGTNWLFIVPFDGQGANGQPPILMPTGDGRYEITFTPADYFGLNGGIITHICAVFNNGTDWTNDGRDFIPGSGICMDFFIPLNFATGNVIHVPADYPTIQLGLDAANYGDTVLVEPGLYQETILVTDGVFLVGSGHNNTVIDGQGIGNSNGSVVQAGDNCLITQFTIMNANTEPYNNLGAGVDAGSNFCELRDNAFTNCRIGIWTQGTMIAERNLIYDNPGLAGIACGSVGYPILINNTIVNCGRGIQFGTYSYPEIKNNIITENLTGIANYGTNIIEVTYNNLYENNVNYYGLPDVTGLYGNVSVNPGFVHPSANDYRLSWPSYPIIDNTMSPCIDKGDPACQYQDPDGTCNDMGAFYFTQMPFTPVAFDPPYQGSTNFLADWSSCHGALGFILDVAQDSLFEYCLPDYDSLVLNDSTSQLDITDLLPGQYYYRVKAFNTNCCSGYSNIVHVDFATGLDETLDNPFNIISMKDLLLIKMDPDISSTATIQVYSTSGQLLHSGQITNDRYQVPLNVSFQILIVKVTLNGKAYTKKTILK